MDDINTQLIPEIEQCLQEYYALDMPRHKFLFEQFLPKGYHTTTLDCVDPKYFNLVQTIKLTLGFFITLTDDYSEHPAFVNDNWIANLKISLLNSEMRAIVIEQLTDLNQTRSLLLAIKFYDLIMSSLSGYSLHQNYLPCIKFDFEQYFQCLDYSILNCKLPNIACGLEYKQHSPHNMGMVLAGMIDLLFSPSICVLELWKMRKVFYLGQRAGHICNTLVTLNREITQGDYNNEITLQLLQYYALGEFKKSETAKIKRELLQKLQAERTALYQEIASIDIKTFSVEKYIDGLKHLQFLHEDLEPYL